MVMAKSYVTTESGNVISRQAQIKGSQRIVLAGKSLIEAGAALRGDLGSDNQPVIGIGRYCILAEGSSVVPPQKDRRVCRIKLGSYVYVGREVCVEAAQIGSCVVLGNNSRVGRLAVVKDCVVVDPGVCVPPFAVVPPHTHVTAAGPHELPESAHTAIERFCREVQTGIDTPVPFLGE